MDSGGWNIADVFERIADAVPDRPAQRDGERVTSWSDFDRRADGVARAFLAAGLGEQEKVAQYLYNCPEYLESVLAALKVGLVPVNTNYRYSDDELVYLWANADVAAVVFHGSFAGTIDRIRDRLPRIKLWLHVDDGSGPCPAWAESHSDTTSSTGGRQRASWGRSGDQLLLMYTGGTTGKPKGVMWRQDDIFVNLDSLSRRAHREDLDLEGVGARARAGGPRALIATPLMHGTGLFNALSVMFLGGTIIGHEGRTYDPAELLETIERYRVNSLTIAGDVFARPLVNELDAHPDRWDISRLRVVFSAGVMWSTPWKEGLLRHNDRLILVDGLGSSEAIGLASSTTTAEEPVGETARFVLGPNSRVLREDGTDVVPGSGEKGMIALGGRTPLGYYKDPEKSAATFRVVDGRRYALPGDWAEVRADGSVQLLGRGSQCINTGGEKVFPEEVEECLKLHPCVADAAVVGIPDEQFGEAIHAIVELVSWSAVAAETLIDFTKQRLARYKSPKVVHFVPSVGRAANGKLDYVELRKRAMA